MTDLTFNSAALKLAIYDILIDIQSNGINTKNLTETVSSAVILNVTTSATGATYVAFTSQVCNVLEINNFSGTDIEYKRNGAGNSFKIANGTTRKIKGVANANEISIRRVDVSNTQVVVGSEAITVVNSDDIITSAITLNVTTDVVGTNYTAFGSQACDTLEIYNYTGVDIEYKRNGAGNSLKIANDGSKKIVGIIDASQISVRRVDVSNTPVTLVAESVII